MPDAQTTAHCEELEELVERVPNWLLRWGGTALAGITALLFVGAWMIEYPDIVAAPVSITTESPPIAVVGRTSGRLRELWVADGDVVEAGAWLAVIESPAATTDVLAIGRVLDGFAASLAGVDDPNADPDASGLDLRRFDPSQVGPPSHAALGELRVAYAGFVVAWQDYADVVADPHYDAILASIDDRLAGNESLAVARAHEREGLEADVRQAERDAHTTARLVEHAIASTAELDRASATVRERRRALDRATVESIGERVTHSQLAGERLVLMHEHRERLRAGLRALHESHAELSRAYDTWTRDYVLRAPIAGTVAFHRVWSRDQWMAQDEEAMTIIPSQGDVLARVELGQWSSGKVDVGQRAVIKLDGYPYREFGVLEGVVASVPAISREGVYLVTLRLPDGLRTSHGTDVVLRHDMRGVAEVVTADLRLLERILFQLRALLGDA